MEEVKWFLVWFFPLCRTLLCFNPSWQPSTNPKHSYYTAMRKIHCILDKNSTNIYKACGLSHDLSYPSLLCRLDKLRVFSINTE